MKYIIGTKIGMTQIFDEAGAVIPVTKVKVGPCQVTQVKTKTTDGYNAVQIGFQPKKKLNKSSSGHLKGLPAFSYLKEVRLPEGETSERGRLIDASCFATGDEVKVSGVTKAKGFQGVVKRHDFAGSPATHGHKDQLRMPGSIGAGGVQKVFKGMRMAGRMGGENMTIGTLVISKIDLEAGEIYIKGAVPGRRGGFVYIEAKGDMPIVKTNEVINTPSQEEVKENVEETKVAEVEVEKLDDSAETSQAVNESNEK